MAGTIARNALAMLLLAASVLGCALSSSELTTCADWVDADADTRASVARDMLDGLWREAGATGAPGDDLVHVFGDGIGSLCRADASATVASIGSRVFDTFPDVQPAAIQASPRPEPSDPRLNQPEEPVAITVDGRVRAEAMISEVELWDSYVGPGGDELSSPGHIFIQLHVRYRSMEDDFEYGPDDWQPIVDGLTRPRALATLENAPPTLAAGTLAAGEEASGFLVFEVPVSGEVILNYMGLGEADPPVHVVLRDAPREF